MGTKTKVAQAPKKTLLDEKPEGLTHLRLRNPTTRTFEIGGGVAGDLHLPPQAELSVDGTKWMRNRALRALVSEGELQAEWVDDLFTPRNLPSLEEAPDDARPDNPIDRMYAQEICLKTDTQKVLELIKVKILVYGSNEPNVQFYKTRMLPILKLAQWLEPQVQNRAPVIKALESQIQFIRSL